MALSSKHLRPQTGAMLATENKEQMQIYPQPKLLTGVLTFNCNFSSLIFGSSIGNYLHWNLLFLYDSNNFGDSHGDSLEILPEYILM